MEGIKSLLTLAALASQLGTSRAYVDIYIRDECRAVCGEYTFNSCELAAMTLDAEVVAVPNEDVILNVPSDDNDAEINLDIEVSGGDLFVEPASGPDVTIEALGPPTVATVASVVDHDSGIFGPGGDAVGEVVTYEYADPSHGTGEPTFRACIRSDYALETDGCFIGPGAVSAYQELLDELSGGAPACCYEGCNYYGIGYGHW